MTDETQIVEQELETTAEAIVRLRETDWYKAFAEEAHSDLVETEFDVRTRTIELHHRLGQRIAQNIDNFKREKVYGKHIVDTIAEDLNRHPSVVRRAMQFYEKAPDLQKFLSDKPKNLSWSKIRNEYLPNATREKVGKDVLEIKEQQLQDEKPVSITVYDLDVAIFTLRDNLELFLDVISAVQLVDKHKIPTRFAKQLVEKFKIEDIRVYINNYADKKTKEDIIFLKELEDEVISINSVSLVNENATTETPLLFENTIPQLSQKPVTKAEPPEDKQPALPLLVSHYKQLYKSKFNREPVISQTSWAKWGKLLKTKLAQGYTISEIIALLQIFAKSKDSDKLAFDPSVLLSDFVFNKMIALKSKSSNVVIEGKYGKY